MEFNPKTCEVDTGKLDSVAEDLLGMVSRISGKTGDMEAHFNNSAKEFSDLIAEDIYSVADENIGAWGDALTACFHVFGVVKKWSQEVGRYRDNIDALQEEWDEAVQNNFGFMDPDDVGIAKAMRVRAESLQTRADKYWETLEGQSEDNTDSLEGGPTIGNLRELVDAGILGFAFYNATRKIMYYPSTAGNGEDHAEDLQPYLDGEKEPDADYYHLLAQLAAINGMALDGQRNGDKLRPDQIEYLEQFYGTLDENGSVVDLPSTLDGNENFEGDDLSELQEALGGGLLALSDGGLGGGYEYLPEDVQNVAEGPNGWNGGGARPGDTGNDQEERSHESWVDAASSLGDLLQAAPSLEGHPMQGGEAFSAHMTVSISEAMDIDYPDENFTPTEELQPLLDISTRNPEGSAVLLTGETTNGNEYSHPGYGNVDLGDVLGNLYQQDWEDDGATVSQITGWIPEYANSEDPDMVHLAGNSSAGLIEAIAADNELYLDLIGIEFEEGSDNDNPAHNIDQTKTSFTENNPALAENFFEIFHTYIDDFGGEVDPGTHNYNTEEEHLNLDPESRARFMQYIAGDHDSAVNMAAAVDAQKLDNLSLGGSDPNSPEVSGSHNGTLQGLLDTAFQNEAMNRTANADEAEIENTERRKEAATMVSDMALAAAKAPAGANPVTSLGADMLEMIIKEDIQNEIDDDIKEDLGDFAEARGSTNTSEGEARRDASLFIIKQLTEGEDSDLSISGISENEEQSNALVGEGDDERVASGIHEVYSRDRSDLDAGIRGILEDQRIPSGPDEEMAADEFLRYYDRNHGEQYDDIVDNLRVDKPEDIAELAGRSV
ncbi:TPR repeat region-containing protein [Nocardiopsis xinjiangensis]|uniref:TPR repeat region-containing protein n=1 Tax=Nocardiopsis xinjiangensis TaxID=124285 RepID=UPI000347CB4E|nr:hypothetical protein [Nocardiopsis xinjiangensis]